MSMSGIPKPTGAGQVGRAIECQRCKRPARFAKTRRCSSCKRRKPAEEFAFNCWRGPRETHRQTYCQVCSNQTRKRQRALAPKKPSPPRKLNLNPPCAFCDRPAKQVASRRCYLCRETLPTSAFLRDCSRGPSEPHVASRCRKCAATKARERRRKARELNALESEMAPSEHTLVQEELIKVGTSLKMAVWIPMNDRGKACENGSLGEEYALAEEFPKISSGAALKAIEAIDVIWLATDGRPSAAFEVERTTDIRSGLLRLADLVTSSPDCALYIVAPEKRRAKFHRELEREPLKFLSDRCRFLAFGEVPNASEEIRRRLR